MWDARITDTSADQFNRISRGQLADFGHDDRAVERFVAAERLVIVEAGVLAMPPVLDDRWGRWMGATLTAPNTYLSHWSAGLAYGFLEWERPFVTVTRIGDGGPRRFGDVLAYRRPSLAGETTELRGVPITTPERVLRELSAQMSRSLLARAFRAAIREKLTTLPAVVDSIGANPGRWTTNLARVCARYADLPLERARSGAEVRALEVLRDAGRELPKLNVRIAGEEADLSWARHRKIIEIDGGPFHLDVGEDRRKQACWEGAAWDVARISSDDVHRRPDLLLALAP